MLDAARDPTADSPAPKTTRLADYRPADFLIDTVELVFELREEATLVKSRLGMRRNPAVDSAGKPLVLDGEALTLVSVALDGETLGTNRYRTDDRTLTIDGLPDAFTLDIETRTLPQNNTELSGLYKSGGNFCTQCEAEGFRRITYFLDRPDVMARYSTTILAEQARYPVLLSNGNPVDHGDSSAGRHWVKWEDPHPKPAYLFALVAGDLVAVKDSFTTKSGRVVALAIWVRQGDEDKCGHAMYALKQAMAWDEEVFGLEYDLDVFNIVAVSDFNMGAMENKGLNIFNTKYVLARPETATDADYQGIETVIAHEYFHNWTGNRVTCRDWFQLSLKEGLTVFRDQQFSADQGSAAVKRILDVRRLRAAQFPEDGGPLAHPVRPDSYIEINNFYTATIYQKGAEIVRMIHTLLGPDGFRKGMDLYVERHDNSAVTIEDFVQAMQDATGTDLQAFKLWYVQAGTPEITAEDDYDAAAKRFTLTLGQTTPATPGQAQKLPVVVPVAMGLLDAASGQELPTRLAGERESRSGTRLLTLVEPVQRFVFEDVAAPAAASLLRGFSAPVKLSGLSLDRLRFLAAHDSDPFARWEAGQQLATKLLLDMVASWRRGDALSLDDSLIAAIENTLAGADADPAFAAEALLLPGEAFLAEQMKTVDVDAIHAARAFARAEIGRRLRPALRAGYDRHADAGPYKTDGVSIGRRALRNACLAYLAAAEDAEAITLAKAQFDAAANMTDVLAALTVLADVDGPEREAALAGFYDTWQHDELVTDKWFAIQATSSRPATLDEVRRLTTHPAFDLKNPNRMRALVGSFAMANQLRFHDAGGAGYAFLAEQIIALDAVNGQMAARMTSPLGTWRRHDEKRQALMKQALQRILAQPQLSRGTFEMTSKSLA
jgi:aminopeptidase N